MERQPSQCSQMSQDYCTPQDAIAGPLPRKTDQQLTVCFLPCCFAEHIVLSGLDYLLTGGAAECKD